MSEYIDLLGSEIIVKDTNVEAFLAAFAGEYEYAANAEPEDHVVSIFADNDFDHTQTITDTKDGVVHCFQWVNEDGQFRGYHEDFFESIAPFVEGYIDYIATGMPMRILFENGKFTFETGEIRFPSSDRWSR